MFTHRTAITRYRHDLYGRSYGSHAHNPASQMIHTGPRPPCVGCGDGRACTSLHAAAPFEFYSPVRHCSQPRRHRVYTSTVHTHAYTHLGSKFLPSIIHLAELLFNLITLPHTRIRTWTQRITRLTAQQLLSACERELVYTVRARGSRL